MVINSKFSIFSLAIFLPVFLSFSSNGSFVFNRVGGIHSEYLYTTPVSLLLISILLFKKDVILWSSKNTSIRNLFLFFLYSILCIVINFLFNEQINPSLLRVTLLLIMFLFLLELFDRYFFQVFTLNQDHSLVVRKYILYPLGIILVITVFSDAFLERSVFLFDSFTVYNYEQYYAFIFVVLSGAFMQSNLRQVFKFSVYLLSLSVALSSANTTATLLMFFLLVWSFFCLNYLKHALYSLVLTLLISIIPIYYLFIYEFYEIGMLSGNFESRVYGIRSYIDGLNWVEFLFPFVQSSRGFSDDMHSQFLEVFNSLGLIGFFYFYGVIFYRLKKIGVKYPDIGISLAIVVFIGGMVGNTTMHPYLSICFAYIIAFYYRLSMVSGKQKI